MKYTNSFRGKQRQTTHTDSLTDSFSFLSQTSHSSANFQSNIVYLIITITKLLISIITNFNIFIILKMV